MRKNKIIKIREIIILSAFATLISCGGRVNSEEKNVSNESNSKKDSSFEIKKDNVIIIDSSINRGKEISHLTDGNFDAEIKNGLVLVDFWASWCGPCRMQAPILEKINVELNGEVKITKLDIDKNRIITDRYGITSIPTLLLFKNGKMVNKFIGYTEKDILMKEIKKEMN